MQRTVTIVFVFLFGGLVAPVCQCQWAVATWARSRSSFSRLQRWSSSSRRCRLTCGRLNRNTSRSPATEAWRTSYPGRAHYLPPDWQTLQAAVTQTSSSYPALSAAAQSSLNSNAVLTSQQLAGMSPVERAQVVAARQSVAMLQAPRARR